MSCAEPARQDLVLRIGGSAGVGWQTNLRVLAGKGVEDFFAEAVPCEGHGLFSVYRYGDFTVGIAATNFSAALAETSFRLYKDLLEAARNAHLCRIWNYVPFINRVSDDGMENYKAFSRGRSLAFESAYGPSFERCLPAGTAVGTDADNLMVVFAAHKQAPVHFENPLQVPAYRYPAEHGPRPPSFARASLVPLPGRCCHAFISGTASIRGHSTVNAGNLAAQLDCTLENLAAIGNRASIGGDLAAGRCARRNVKVYLRRDSTLSAVRARLHGGFLHPDDHVSFLRADLCRRDLDVEIEVSLFGVRLPDA